MRVKMVIEVSQDEVEETKNLLKESGLNMTIEEFLLEQIETDLYDYLDEVPKVEVV